MTAHPQTIQRPCRRPKPSTSFLQGPGVCGREVGFLENDIPRESGVHLAVSRASLISGRSTESSGHEFPTVRSRENPTCSGSSLEALAAQR